MRTRKRRRQDVRLRESGLYSNVNIPSFIKSHRRYEEEKKRNPPPPVASPGPIQNGGGPASPVGR